MSRFHDDLNMIAIIGTSDRLCWLAETCKILLPDVTGYGTNYALCTLSVCANSAPQSLRSDATYKLYGRSTCECILFCT